MRALFFVPLVFAAAISAASGQTAARPPAAPAPSAAAAATPAPAASPGTPPAAGAAAPGAPSAESYTYQPEGRRDPFLNLLGTGSDPVGAGKRGEGAAGLTVAEVSVSGVLESRGALIAMIQGPDKKSYIVHPGDRFVDGTIRAITEQGLTIVQEVNDPLSLVKQREIHKLLRSLESVKE